MAERQLSGKIPGSAGQQAAEYVPAYAQVVKRANGI